MCIRDSPVPPPGGSATNPETRRASGSCRTDKEEATPRQFYQRIYNKVASWISPELFIFSAVLVVCSVSIFLNVRLAERMQQLQDNDMKYRYLLMQGQADRCV